MSFLAVSNLVTPKSRLENSVVGTLNDIVSAITMPLITLMIQSPCNHVVRNVLSHLGTVSQQEQVMEYLCYIAVIYVAADLAASAYVVIKRGGIASTIAEIRQNLGVVRDTEDDDDVHDRY